MYGPPNLGALGLLMQARDAFAGAIRPGEMPPDLHAVIVDGDARHPLLHQDGPLPRGLPVEYQFKKLIRSSFIAAFHPVRVRIHYFGDPGLLGRFLEFSRLAYAALCELRPGDASEFERFQREASRDDLPEVIAGGWLIALRNILNAPELHHRRNQWRSDVEPGLVPIDVTVFTGDIFTRSKEVLDGINQIARLLAERPPDPVESSPDGTPAQNPPAGNPPPAQQATSSLSKSPGKRRGRTKGVDKIGSALSFVVANMKDSSPVDIPTIAILAACSPQSLRQSKRFMKGYRVLTTGMEQVRRGRKEDGVADADNF